MSESADVPLPPSPSPQGPLEKRRMPLHRVGDLSLSSLKFDIKAILTFALYNKPMLTPALCNKPTISKVPRGGREGGGGKRQGRCLTSASG